METKKMTTKKELRDKLNEAIIALHEAATLAQSTMSEHGIPMLGLASQLNVDAGRLVTYVRENLAESKGYQAQFKNVDGVWVRAQLDLFSSPGSALTWIGEQRLTGGLLGGNVRSNWRVVPQGHLEFIS